MPLRFVHTADIYLDSPLQSLALRDPALAELIGGATCLAFERAVQLSRIRPFCGRVPLNLRLGLNDLAAAVGGENAAKLLNLTVPSRELLAGRSTSAQSR